MDPTAPTRRIDSAVDEIAFVANSARCVGVLEALAAGPQTRAELRDATGASAPTMSRVLSDFSDRRRVEQRDALGVVRSPPARRQHERFGGFDAVESPQIRLTLPTRRR